jgi:membrane-associated phospholipid phosphatase
MLPMNSVIGWLANYLLFVMAAVAVATWIVREDRRTRLSSAAVAAFGLLIALALMVLAAHLHTDARPFVQNPSLHPLIKHSADNGFPSDHSVAAALIATVVILRHRLIGAGLALAALVVAVARVAAHVHHLQDVAAGLAIGVLAALLAGLLVGWLAAQVADRRARPASAGRAASG